MDQTCLPGRFADRADDFFAGFLIMDSGHHAVADVPYPVDETKKAPV
jgi:hypothetical protein